MVSWKTSFEIDGFHPLLLPNHFQTRGKIDLTHLFSEIYQALKELPSYIPIVTEPLIPWLALQLKIKYRHCGKYRSGVFIVNWEHISHLVLVFLLLTLSRQMPDGYYKTLHMREKCRYLNFFWSVSSRIRTKRRVNIRVQCKCRKMRTRKTPNTDTF